MAVFEDLTVQTTTIDGTIYRLVETAFDCPILARIQESGFWFLLDDDTISRTFAERWQCLRAAEAYRTAITEAGGEPVDFTREVYVERDSRLAFRAQITRVERAQGVVGRMYLADGTLNPDDHYASDVRLLPADLLGAGVITAAEDALQRMRNAEQELRDAQVELATLGAQLRNHSEAIHVPPARQITEATRVELESALAPLA